MSFKELNQKLHPRQTGRKKAIDRPVTAATASPPRDAEFCDASGDGQNSRHDNRKMPPRS